MATPGCVDAGTRFATRPAEAPDLPMPVPIPNFTVRMATQQLQFLFASRCGRHAGKNALVKALRAALVDERGLLTLQLLAGSVHEGLKTLPYPWDVWLNGGRMELLRSWREQVGGTTWGRLGAVSCSLIGGKPIDSARLSDWRIQRRGYLA